MNLAFITFGLGTLKYLNKISFVNSYLTNKRTCKSYLNFNPLLNPIFVCVSWNMCPLKGGTGRFFGTPNCYVAPHNASSKGAENAGVDLFEF